MAEPSDPTVPTPLSDTMATAIGRSVAAFGFLEEVLKRTIFSLTRQGLGVQADDAALRDWLQRMEDIADDSLGTLIDSLGAALRQAQIADRAVLATRLSALRRQRNLICHASWRQGERPGHWHPGFINTHGERYPDDMTPADIDTVRSETVAVAARIAQIMRATGIEGQWTGHDDTAGGRQGDDSLP